MLCDCLLFFLIQRKRASITRPVVLVFRFYIESRYRLKKKQPQRRFLTDLWHFRWEQCDCETNESIWSWLAVLSMYMKTFWLSESFSFFNDKKNCTRAVVSQTYRGTCKGQWLGTGVRLLERVIRALCSYFLAWVYNGYKGFSGYNRIQLMMLDDRKVPKWREQKNLPKIKIIAYHIQG